MWTSARICRGRKIRPAQANIRSRNGQDLVPSLSLRELERGPQIGLNATQTTLGAIAQLAGAKLK